MLTAAIGSERNDSHHRTPISVSRNTEADEMDAPQVPSSASAVVGPIRDRSAYSRSQEHAEALRRLISVRRGLESGVDAPSFGPRHTHRNSPHFELTRCAVSQPQSRIISGLVQVGVSLILRAITPRYGYYLVPLHL